MAEYTTTSSSLSTLGWKKSYIYAGSRLLSTSTNNGSGGETWEFQHPDRLGTYLVTNPGSATQYEQATLPFGTDLTAETTGTTNERFTSYDRSTVASLDYAVNRSYSNGQGRFTSVDPLGMGASSMGNPQSLNLFAYVKNDPINSIDPSGLDELDDIVREAKRRASDLARFISDSEELHNSRSGTTSGGGGGGGASTHDSPKQQKSNCYTFYQLIYEHEYVQEIINKIWDQTYQMAKEIHDDPTSTSTGGELGGVLFFDQPKNVIQFNQYSGYKSTPYGEVARLPEDFMKQLEIFKESAIAGGESGRILLAIHSHPPDFTNRGPGQNGQEGDPQVSFDDTQNLTHSAYGGWKGPIFGIVVYGKGKFSVYGPGEYKIDDETLKRICISTK